MVWGLHFPLFIVGNIALLYFQYFCFYCWSYSRKETWA